MVRSELKLVLRHLAVGFGLGLVVTLAVGYGAAAFSGPSRVSVTTSAQ